MRLFLLAALAAMLTVPGPARAADPTPIPVSVPSRKEPVSYVREVADVLGAKCVGCHNEALAENKLNMESPEAMIRGGKRGPSVVAGKAEESLLFKMAAHRVEPVMPPAAKKDAPSLTPAELGLLKLWIDAGAKDDSAEAEQTGTPVEIGSLPPGVHAIGAVDLLADGSRVACGRANVVQVYDAVSGLEILSLGGHKDLVQSVRFSPDGRFLAAGSYAVVTLWNAPTGKLDYTATGHADVVTALAVGRDGKTLVSAGLDKSVRFWDVNGKEVREIKTPAGVTALALSADGKRLALGGTDKVVRVLNADDGKELVAFAGHEGPVNDLAFLDGPDGLVSVSDDGTARRWTLPDKAGEPATEPEVWKAGKGPALTLAVAPDGTSAYSAGEDGVIRLWQVGSNAPTREFPAIGSPVVSLALSGDLLAAGLKDGTARLIDIHDGSIRQTLAGHRGPVRSVAFQPDGARVVTAGDEGGLKVWEVATGQGVIAFGHGGADGSPLKPLRKVIVPAAGRIVSASADKTVKTWSFDGAWSERKPLGPHADRVLALDFNADGTLLAAGGGEPSRSGEVKLWEVGKGMLVRTSDSLHSDTVFSLRFSPDGSKLATAGADKFLKVSRVSDGKEIRSFEGHTQHVMAVDWKGDGKQLVTGGADNVLKVWDAESGEQLRTLTSAGKQVTAVRWVPTKSQVAAASGDKVVRIWNPEGGVLRTFSGPSDYVFAVATSADGERVAAGGADGVLFVWNGKDGKVLRKIEPAAAQAPKLSASNSK